MTNKFVYEVYLHDNFLDEPLLFMDRYNAFESAKYYANKGNEPIAISVRVHGSPKRVCELTIYPDNAERLEDGC